MKKQILVNSVIYLICMVVACLLNLAVSWLVVKIVLSVADIGFFATAILRAVVGLLTGGTVIGAIVYRECYKSLEFHPAPLALSLGIAGVAHLLLSLLLMFYPFIAGGVRYLAGVINMGSGFSADARIDDIYLWAYLAAFGIDLAFRIGVALICGAVGKKMRLKSREDLTGYHSSEKSSEMR